MNQSNQVVTDIISKVDRIQNEDELELIYRFVREKRNGNESLLWRVFRRVFSFSFIIIIPFWLAIVFSDASFPPLSSLADLVALLLGVGVGMLMLRLITDQLVELAVLIRNHQAAKRLGFSRAPSPVIIEQ